MPALSYKIILLALLEVQFRLIHLHYTFLSDVDFTFRYFNLWILQYLMLSVGSFGNWQPEFIRIKPTRLQNSHWLGLENRASCVGKTFGPRSVTPVPFVVNALVLAKLRLFFSYKAFQSNLKILDVCQPTILLEKLLATRWSNPYQSYLFLGDDHENQTFAALSLMWMVSMGVEVDVWWGLLWSIDVFFYDVMDYANCNGLGFWCVMKTDHVIAVYHAIDLDSWWLTMQEAAGSYEVWFSHLWTVIYLHTCSIIFWATSHALGHAKHVWNLQIVCLPKPPTERARLAVGLQESHACRCLRVLRWQLAAVGWPEDGRRPPFLAVDFHHHYHRWQTAAAVTILDVSQWFLAWVPHFSFEVDKSFGQVCFFR